MAVEDPRRGEVLGEVLAADDDAPCGGDPVVQRWVGLGRGVPQETVPELVLWKTRVADPGDRQVGEEAEGEQALPPEPNDRTASIVAA